MKSHSIATYADSKIGVDLEPTRTRLLFAAWISHGPGFSEKVEYRIGPSKCGRFDVLWTLAEPDVDERIHAAAWMPRHEMKGKSMHCALLEALFQMEKTHFSADGPNFSEVIGSDRVLLSSKEVWQITYGVFSQIGK